MKWCGRLAVAFGASLGVALFWNYFCPWALVPTKAVQIPEVSTKSICERIPKTSEHFTCVSHQKDACNRIYIIFFSLVAPKNVGKIQQEGKIACRSENHIKSKYLTLSEQQRRETNIYMTAECKLVVWRWVRKNNKKSVWVEKVL